MDLHVAAGDANVMQNFGEAWLAAFRTTEAFAVWDRVTDPVIFDIVEPRYDPITPHSIA